MIIIFSGCATIEHKAAHVPGPVASPVELVREKKVYHKVVRGQTLWRIARTYGVPVEELIKNNKIPNVAAIEVDQLIFIPGAKEPKEIPPRTPDENQEEFIWPVKGKVIAYFNESKGDAASRGVDIEANEGDTIKASRKGIVVMADYMAGYGQTLMIDHGDGFITVYAENRKLLSKVGDNVYKGDPIAEAGRTGNKSFLHFELRKGERAVNPLYYLP